MNSNSEPKLFSGRALVTGASAGIGAAIALRLLGCGYDVALFARRSSPMDRLVAQATLAGRQALVFPVDLGDRAATDAALAALVTQWPTLDALVINAGMNAEVPLDGASTEAFDRLLEVNLAGPFRMIRALAPRVVDGGRIVTISSVLARFGVPGAHGYCASKAGLLGLSRALAVELAPRRITVNSVLPGWTDTEMANDSIAAQGAGLGLDAAVAKDAFLARVPLRRMAEPTEVAALVQFLLTRDAAYVTGQAWNIDGGVTA